MPLDIFNIQKIFRESVVLSIEGINSDNNNYRIYNKKTNSKLLGGGGYGLPVRRGCVALTNENDFAVFNSSENLASSLDPSICSTFLKDELKEIKNQQGFAGKIWDGFKNLTSIGAGSNKAQKAVKQFENGEISFEEAKNKIDKYSKGQDMCVDVAGDLVSGIVSFGAFMAAVPTGGLSLGVGLGLAAGAGAAVKVGIKGGDALSAGRKYSGKDLLYDSTTGAVNGLFAPVSNGVGVSVTKSVAQKLGLTVVKEGTEEVLEQGTKQGLKTIITQQGVDVIGGSFAKRAVATSAGMAVDGAIGGATDNMARAALNGENVLEAGVEGAIGGLVMSPVIGGGFKLAGKAGNIINNSITTSKLFPNGMETAFKQGDTGDCALLSVINGLMDDTTLQNKIKNSITKSAGGNYHVRIGNKTVNVAKSALTDEAISDVSGIKIFETAYRQLAGDIDGGFADSIAKQFGLNPVHITEIDDELLDNISKQKSTVLSLGTQITDENGSISNHYFTIKDVDSANKKVFVTDPYDTSKTIELSYDEVKSCAISIDGGSLNKTTLNNIERSPNDVKFRGKANKDYDIETLGKIENQNWDDPYTIDINDSSLLFKAGETEFQLTSDMKKYLNNNDCIVLGQINDKNTGYFKVNGLEEQHLLVYSNGTVIDCSSGEIPVEICKKLDKAPSLTDISEFRTTTLSKNSEAYYSDLTSSKAVLERIEKFLDDEDIIILNKMYKNKEINSDELKVILLSLENKTSANRALDLYKNDSKKGFTQINKTLEDISTGKSASNMSVLKNIDSITAEIEKQTLPDNLTLYRNEGYELLDTMQLSDGQTLGSTLKKLQDEYNAGGNKADIEKFLAEFAGDIKNLSAKQCHFMSSNMVSEAENFKDAPIHWIMTTQNNQKGVFIPNSERYKGKELEVLLQRDSTLFLNSIDFDFARGCWVIKANVSN